MRAEIDVTENVESSTNNKSVEPTVADFNDKVSGHAVVDELDGTETKAGRSCCYPLEILRIGGHVLRFAIRRGWRVRRRRHIDFDYAATNLIEFD